MSCQSSNDIVGADYTYSTLPIPGYDATVVDTKVGNDFPFKPFFSGTGILVDETTNPGAITINATGATLPYTYSTEIAGDATVVGTQVANNFGFRPINGGTNIDVSTVLGAVVIDGPTYASNVVPGSDANITAAQVGNEFRFKPLNAGANITIEETTLPGAITISASTATQQLFQNNTLFVDAQYGNNATGTRERRDLPYQTITAAYNAALSGDKIHVFPGFYTDSINATLQTLSFYLENEVFWSTNNTPLLSITGGISYSIDGHGTLISSLVNGGIISVLGGFPYINFSANTVSILNSATGFRLGNGNANIRVSRITSSGTVLTAFNNNSPSTTTIRLTADTIDSNSTLFSLSGGDRINFLLDANYIRAFGSSNIINCAQASITINANSFEVDGGGQFFDITDISLSPTTRSLLDFVINTDFLRINAVTFIRALSTKNKTASSLYPRISVNFNNMVTSNTNNTNIFDFTRAELYLNGNSAILNDVTGYVCNMTTGRLFIDIDVFYCVSGVTSNFIDTDECYIKSNTFTWNGGLVSNSGFAKCQTMTCVSSGQILGSWNIETNYLSMTGSNLILLSASTGILSLRAEEAIFNTGINNPAIVASSTIRLDIKKLTFTFTTPHYLVSINSSTDNIINAGLIENMALVVTNQSILTINCDLLVNTVASNSYTITNGGLVNATINTIRLLNKSAMFESIGFVGSSPVFNLRSNVIEHTSSLGTQPVLFDASFGGSFNVVANKIDYNPTTNGFLALNSSIGVTSTYRIGTLTCSGLALGCFRQSGVANSLITIDEANINCILLIAASSTVKSTLSCGYATSTTQLIDILSAPGLLEISGTYSTTFNNVITCNISGTIGLHGVKLLSPGNCINSSGALTVSITPSSARVAPVGTTIIPVGALFINPGLV